MRRLRRVWSPRDAQDAAVAAAAVHAKGQGVVAVPAHHAHDMEDALAPHGILVWPFVNVPGRTRGRHRANRFSLRLSDLAPKPGRGGLVMWRALVLPGAWIVMSLVVLIVGLYARQAAV